MQTFKCCFIVFLTMSLINFSQPHNPDWNGIVADNIADIFGSNHQFTRNDAAERMLQDSKKCGEGLDQGVHECVPYHMCPGFFKKYVSMVDFRTEAPKTQKLCDHYMDVCCKVSEIGRTAIELTIVQESETNIKLSLEIPIETKTSDSCGIRNPRGIDFPLFDISARDAQYGEFPWMIEILQRRNDKTVAVCGGSLINLKAVVTSAHCVRKYEASDLKIRAGEWDTQTTKERLSYQDRNVARIVMHPKYSSRTIENNIALLILDSPVNAADNIGTICMPTQGQVIRSSECYVTGWGKSRFGATNLDSEILKKIKLPLVGRGLCQRLLQTTRLGKRFHLHETFLCAGGQEGVDACTGDGGGPLVCPDPRNPNLYQLTGIVSWGIGCGEDGLPGVYTNVAKFQNWVDEEMRSNSLKSTSYTV